MAGGFGEEGFVAGQSAQGGTTGQRSAPVFGEDEVCWKGPYWSLVCDTAVLLARCVGRKREEHSL